jgi:excisionase family DNA binding protein
MDSLLTLNEAAALAGVVPDSLRQAVLQGRLSATKRGHQWFVERVDVERYIERRRPNYRRTIDRSPATSNE